MKKALITTGFIIVIILGLILSDILHQKEIRNLSVNEVNLSTFADGVYNGEFKKYRWEYKVNVEIKNCRIIDIDFDDKQPSEYDEKVIQKVIDDQKINVDSVSGATINDKILIKSIENALDK